MKQICVNVSVNSSTVEYKIWNMSHKTSINYIMGEISNILAEFLSSLSIIVRYVRISHYPDWFVNLSLYV